jgi:hypothetical protein
MSRVTLDPSFPPTAIQAEQILLGKLIHAGADALTELRSMMRRWARARAGA